MKRLFFAIASMAAIFFGGCADNLSPEQNDKPPGAYSPDPSGNIPKFYDGSHGGL